MSLTNTKCKQLHYSYNFSKLTPQARVKHKHYHLTYNKNQNKIVVKKGRK